jgi:hypothetical protein
VSLQKAERCDDWSAQSVANLVWALGVYRHTPTKLVTQATVRHLTQNLGDYPGHAVASTLQSFKDCGAVIEVELLDQLVKGINGKATIFSRPQLNSIDFCMTHLAGLAAQKRIKA